MFILLLPMSSSRQSRAIVEYIIFLGLVKKRRLRATCTTTQETYCMTFSYIPLGPWKRRSLAKRVQSRLDGCTKNCQNFDSRDFKAGGYQIMMGISYESWRNAVRMGVRFCRNWLWKSSCYVEKFINGETLPKRCSILFHSTHCSTTMMENYYYYHQPAPLMPRHDAFPVLNCSTSRITTTIITWFPSAMCLLLATSELLLL